MELSSSLTSEHFIAGSQVVRYQILRPVFGCLNPLGRLTDGKCSSISLLLTSMQPK